MFGQLKSDADRLAADAASRQRERNVHARRSYAIFRRRIASPPGLVACFGAGVFAGARSRRPAPADDGEHRSSRDHEPEQGGGSLVHRVLHNPVGAAALRLGTAWLAGRLMQPAPPESTDHDFFL